MALRLEEKNYKEVENYLLIYMYRKYYEAIQAIILDTSDKVRVNSKADLLNALNSGRVVYKSGVFSGTYNAAISNELRKFSIFDGRSKTWKALDVSKVPNYIKEASIKATSRLDSRNQQITKVIDSIDKDESIDKMLTPVGETIDDFENELNKDYEALGINMSITPEQKENIAKDYNRNMSLSINNWKDDQVERLRDMTVKMFEGGFDGQSLKDLIMSEWEVSANKAKFLARQETSLFLSKYRKEQSLKAGVRKYKWSASGGKTGDGRTRTRHRHLHGKVYAFGNPPVTDDLGNRNEPGEDYNCRCVAIPVLD